MSAEASARPWRPAPSLRQVAPLLLGAGIAMGLAMPLGKAAIQRGLSPLAFVLWPALAAGIVLLAIAWARHGRVERPRRLVVFGLVAGLLGHAVPNTLVAWLSSVAGAGFSGLAYTMPPVFTLLVLLALRVQAFSAARVVAVTLGLAGATWLALVRLQGGEVSALAAFLILAIPAVIGAGNVYRSLRLPEGVPAEWLGAAVTLGGFSLLLPLWLATEAASAVVPLAAMPYIAAQVAAASIGAILFFELQRVAEPVTMSFVGYVMAITALVVGALALGETLPWQLAPAGAMIVAAFVLITRAR